MPTKIWTQDLYLWYHVRLLCSNQFTQKLKLINKGGQIIYTLIDGDGWEAKSEESKHSAEDLSYPIPRKRERSLHTCAQDVQITRMATIW
jgi:hypothetical protein